MLRDVIDIIDFLDNSSNSADASVAMHLEWNGERVVAARVSLGPVSPLPIRAGAVESAIVADELRMKQFERS